MGTIETPGRAKLAHLRRVLATKKSAVGCRLSPKKLAVIQREADELEARILAFEARKGGKPEDWL